MEQDTLLPKSSSQSIFYSLASISLVILGLIYFSGILKPFFIAFLIWYLINQVNITIGKLKINGKTLPSLFRSILSFIMIMIVVYLVSELLIVNIEGIATHMPDYLENFNSTFENASAFIHNPKFTEHFQNWFNELNLPGMATTALNSITSAVGTSAVVIVYVIFFLLEAGTQRLKVDKLFPQKRARYLKFRHNLDSINKSIHSYVWSMTWISLITGGVSYVILLIMQVDYAFFWAFLIFILNFIPYIGPLISSLLPAIFAVLIFSNLWMFVYVFAAMEGVQIIIGNFIQPMVMGKGTNISPVVVIVALAFWGLIWGITGMILAIPLTAVLVIILSQFPSTRYFAILLSEKGDIPDLEEIDTYSQE